MEMPASLTEAYAPDPEAARAVVERAFAEGRPTLTAPGSQGSARLLRRGGRAFPHHRGHRRRRGRGRGPGHPVAVKIISRTFPQPFDVGGLVLDVPGPDAVREAVAAASQRALDNMPGARIEGYVIQAASRRAGAHELTIQARVDPVFGPYIIFGQGRAGRQGHPG